MVDESRRKLHAFVACYVCICAPNPNPPRGLDSTAVLWGYPRTPGSRPPCLAESSQCEGGEPGGSGGCPYKTVSYAARRATCSCVSRRQPATCPKLAEYRAFWASGGFRSTQEVQDSSSADRGCRQPGRAGQSGGASDRKRLLEKRRGRGACPTQNTQSLGIAPPHLLHGSGKEDLWNECV
jgi:hypothetical protein